MDLKKCPTFVRLSPDSRSPVYFCLMAILDLLIDLAPKISLFTNNCSYPFPTGKFYTFLKIVPHQNPIFRPVPYRVRFFDRWVVIWILNPSEWDFELIALPFLAFSRQELGLRGKLRFAFDHIVLNIIIEIVEIFAEPVGLGVPPSRSEGSGGLGVGGSGLNELFLRALGSVFVCPYFLGFN